MGEKLRVGWIVGNQNWAYKNIMEHFKKVMTEYQHIENDETADIVVMMSPPQLRKVTDKGKVILHLDSKRILDL